MSKFPKRGLKFERIEGLEIPALVKRDAIIVNAKNEVVFEQKGVLFPESWSDMAVRIVASKYFHGKLGDPNREHSLAQLIIRVVLQIRTWGMEYGYFQDWVEADNFQHNLSVLLYNQYFAFNSPVWFNLGASSVSPDSKARNWHWNRENSLIQNRVVGYTRPQCSACFINSVEDSMESILELAKTEGMLFKFGSGTGTNLSTLRSAQETLAGGGIASGPVSFMRGFDAFAGVIKSGGTTRRAAKMVILNADHPDIEEFILCKGKEEAKAHALMREGYDGTSGPESEAYLSIAFQNANNSVRATDSFMELATDTSKGMTLGWPLRAVSTGETVKTVDAMDILWSIAKQTHECGDPGMQFDTTINHWHTCAASGRINASNPCSEYMFLDDTACNLASFNLLKFYKDGVFDADFFAEAVALVTTAMDIIVDGAGYPTEKIARNSHDYRPLGLGYANLGALLMEMGYAYDSNEGRQVAALITSVMGGHAYFASARMAEHCPELAPADIALESDFPGSFPGYTKNQESFLRVIRQHRAATVELIDKDSPLFKPNLRRLAEVAEDGWLQAENHGELHGFRNSQVTVLAPTGTIGFMMDCDTTGVEPMLGLVVYKKMVGGGFSQLTNPVVERALQTLGYSPSEIKDIRAYILEKSTVVDAPHVKPEHYAIFDCAFAPAGGGRSIHYLGHIRMMEVTQPFLSGAISKTVNMPEDSTVEDIFNAYVESWKRGLKAVAIYRDGSKKNQVMVTSKDEDKAAATSGNSLKDVLGENSLADIAEALWEHLPDDHVAQDSLGNLLLPGRDGRLRSSTGGGKGGTVATSAEVEIVAPQDLNAAPKAVRHKLSEERPAVIHKFSIAGHEGYITVGLYPNGTVGELFITMAKEGSTLSGVMDAFATSVSIGLQHGVPLSLFVQKFAHTRFEPSGWSQNPKIGLAKSIMDYIFRWLDIRFLQVPQAKEETDGGGYLFVGREAVAAGNEIKAKVEAVLEQAAVARPSSSKPASSVSVRPEPVNEADAMARALNFGDSPSCSACGAIMVRNGACYRCMECGGTSGCS